MAADAARDAGRQIARAPAHRDRRTIGPGPTIVGALAALVLLAVAGWWAWTYGAAVGLRFVEFDSPASLVALGFVAGIGAFFAPCAFALFPAYVSYHLGASGTRGGTRSSLVLGLACASGAALFFAALGVMITSLGGGLSPYLIAAKPVVAVGVIGLGIAQLVNIPMPALPFQPVLRSDRRIPAVWAVFLYGFVYGLATTGCTLPLYVSIVVLPLTSGFSGAALLTFLSFASAMAALMLATTLLVGFAKHELLATFQQATPWIKRGSGAVLIFAGVYLGYYYLTTGM